MGDETVSIEGLDALRFWRVFDLHAACRVTPVEAYRALVEAEWDADAARRRLEGVHP